MSDGMAVILPTRESIQLLRTRLSIMERCDYDINELMSWSVTCLEQQDVYALRIAEQAENILHTAKCGMRSERDAEILSKAWFEFTMTLAFLYDRAKMWSVQGNPGIASFYFSGFQGGDMMMRAFPT